MMTLRKVGKDSKEVSTCEYAHRIHSLHAYAWYSYSHIEFDMGD